MIASETIVGSLCYRLFDTAYSSQQRILIEEYKKTLVTNKVNYFDSKKARNKTVRQDIRGIPIEALKDKNALSIKSYLCSGL